MPATCTSCSHDFDSHVVVLVPTGAPAPEGIIRCPEFDCRCWATWAARTASTTPTSPGEQLTLRARILETLKASGLLHPDGTPQRFS